jgi:glycerol-3-phosphate dehydrogenase
VVWTYSGVRPLYDDGASSATAATRDYVLSLDDAGGAPLLNVFGGKITTYRRLAESALEKLAVLSRAGKDWTAGVPLPGGDFPVDGFERAWSRAARRLPLPDERWARGWCAPTAPRRARSWAMRKTPSDLGRGFRRHADRGGGELAHDREYARSAEDVIWRRSKLGLRLTKDRGRRGWRLHGRHAPGQAAE